MEEFNGDLLLLTVKYIVLTSQVFHNHMQSMNTTVG